MRFLVDENLPVDVQEVLLADGHDVLYVRQSDHRGATDRDLWQLAASEERVLVTRDLDFPLPDNPRPPALVLLRVPDSFTRKQIRAIMGQFVASSAFQEIDGRITVVSPGRVRTRKL